jgi:hypothetical protein
LISKSSLFWLGCFYKSKLDSIIKRPERQTTISIFGHDSAQIRYFWLWMLADVDRKFKSMSKFDQLYFDMCSIKWDPNWPHWVVNMAATWPNLNLCLIKNGRNWTMFSNSLPLRANRPCILRFWEFWVPFLKFKVRFLVKMAQVRFFFLLCRPVILDRSNEYARIHQAILWHVLNQMRPKLTLLDEFYARYVVQSERLSGQKWAQIELEF